MGYIYFLANASLILHVIELLNCKDRSVKSMTVIHRPNGWIVKIQFKHPLTLQDDGDIHALMTELGTIYKTDKILEQVFSNLEKGISPIIVMRQYSVAVVSHGLPNKKHIEEFRKHFTTGLGYYPESLA